MTGLIKVAFVGACYVGKTCLCNVIVNKKNSFDNYSRTIGINYILRKINDKRVAIYDLSGSKTFGLVTDSYVNKCDILFLCYSVDDEESYTYMLDKHNQYIGPYKIIIIQTKSDSANRIQSLEQTAQSFASFKNYKFISTSSFNEEGISDVIKEMNIDSPDKPEIYVDVTTNLLEINETKKCCCNI